MTSYVAAVVPPVLSKLMGSTRTQKTIKSTTHKLKAYIFQRSFLIFLFFLFFFFWGGGAFNGGAYVRREICVSKSAGLIIGGKFVSAFSPCANNNIGALTRNSWQLVSLNMPTSSTTATTLLKMEVWVRGGRIELPCKCFLYGLKEPKVRVRSALRKWQ